MKTKQTETKFKSAPGLACYLFGRVLCLGAVILIYSSASAQNLFVSVSGQAWGNPGRGSIYKFTPNGARTTFAVGLNYPQGLAFDRAGNLFVADVSVSSNSVTSSIIYKFTPDGVRTTFASGLSSPVGLAFDSAGNLFVADSGSGSILKFTPAAVRTTFASGLNQPVGLAFDRAGNLLVTDGGDVVGPGHGHVYKFTPNGARSTLASGFITPNGLAFDSAGNLFLADGGDIDGLGGAIYKFTPGGVRTTFAPGDFFIDEFGLAIDGTNNLFVPDLGPGNIYKFTPGGLRSVFASIPSNFQSGVTPVSLTFEPTLTATPTLVNISTRGSVETGSGVTILGFIITGTDSKQVVVRGLGPTLTQYNVSGVLADPFVSLFDGDGNVVYTNNNWKDSQQAAIQATGLAPPNDLESAILRTLQPGNYTAVLSGKNSTTGIGLLELYSTPSGLTNVSIRGFVGTGDNVLISGFSSSGGNGTIQLIIRALGPTLTQFGVSGALADPTLSLIDGNGNVVAFNDNWKNTQKTAIQNTGFAPPNDLESAILATLPNGNYTAIMSGKNGATGVGLVEVYKVALAVSQ